MVLSSCGTDQLRRRAMIRNSKSATSFTWPTCRRVIKLSLPELATWHTSVVLYHLYGCAPATRQAPTGLGQLSGRSSSGAWKTSRKRSSTTPNAMISAMIGNASSPACRSYYHPWGYRRNLQIYEEEKQEGLKASLEAERLAMEDVEDAD